MSSLTTTDANNVDYAIATGTTKNIMVNLTAANSVPNMAVATTPPPSTSVIARYPSLGFLAGAIAACGAVTITNPLEVVKTRMQLQGELNRKSHVPAVATPSSSSLSPSAVLKTAMSNNPATTTTRNVITDVTSFTSSAGKESLLTNTSKGSATRIYTGTFSALITIAKFEGFAGLQRGLGAAYAYQVAMNGVRLGSYEPVKRLLLQWSSSPQYDNISTIKPVVDPLWCRVAAGGTAGAIGALLGSPLFLVKTRLQSYSEHLGVGHQHRYRSALHALHSVFTAEGGVIGLFRGAGAAILRTTVGSAVQLSTYDSCKVAIMKQFGLQDGVPAHAAASFLTGRNPVTGAGLFYRGPIDCFVKTIRTEGIAGLYKGISAHYLRIGPHTILTFVFLEQAKSAIETIARRRSQ
ncbi:mitochondrial carrier domain-containing protein [Syncephalis fuscata]|nr:mitochondrial carrier domain-containing protein [Syncephalis fuscata]